MDQKQCTNHEVHVQIMKFMRCLNMVFTKKSSRQAAACVFNGCEVLIENSVTRVTVRHHEAHEQLSRVTEFSIHTEQPL